MDLGKINRDAEDRSVVWAAAVTALMGLTALLGAAAAQLDAAALEARINVVMALVFFGLAYAVFRGSRAAAVGVVALFVLRTLVLFLAGGLMATSPVWTLILGAILWAGMRGVFAQAVRPAGAGPRPRRSA